MIKAPPQPVDEREGDLVWTADSGSPSIGPLMAQPVPQFPVLPRPPPGSAGVPGTSQVGTLDGQWMSEAWRSVKGMERRWERLRQARGTAVSSALDQATAVISEVGEERACPHCSRLLPAVKGTSIDPLRAHRRKAMPTRWMWGTGRQATLHLLLQAFRALRTPARRRERSRAGGAAEEGGSSRPGCVRFRGLGGLSRTRPQ
jgi:hypothetical protein